MSDARYRSSIIMNTMKRRHAQKLIIVSWALLVLFNAPILLLFDSTKSVFGLPMIYAYLFSVWLFSSVVSFFIFKRFDE